ncbi:MAG: phage holin family protein [Acidobacteria bacterium]|nr:phage holin family protein [Acidobacteriota bacterium]
MHEFDARNHGRSLGDIIAEIRDQLKQLLLTRLEMLKAELHETLAGLRVAAPLILAVLAFLVTAFLLFSAAAVALVVSAFSGNPYAWFFGFAIVGVLWVIFGAVAAFFAYNEFRSKAGFPKRTVGVLKADKDWLGSEARTNYGRTA